MNCFTGSFLSKAVFLVVISLAVLQIVLQFGKVAKKQESIPLFKPSLRFRGAIGGEKAIPLFVGIYSYPTFIERRTALRETWMYECKKSDDAVCFFMMDAFDFKGNRISEELRTKFEKENNTFHDIMIQDSFGGLNFAYRYFITVIWAYERYDFEFVLRTDDDVYLCFDHLMYDLPHRKKEKNLLMGFEGCGPKFTEIDEGWLLVSKDLAMEFINRFNTTLPCHRFTSVALSLFILNSRNEFNVTWFGDNERVPFGSYASVIRRENFCNHYIAIHLVYEQNILNLHQHFLKSKVKQYVIPPIHDYCPDLHEVVDIPSLHPTVRIAPILCKKKPIFDGINGNHMWVGEQGRRSRK